jgi:hypothetical protein
VQPKSEEIKRLRAQLREKELKIKALSESFEFRATPQREAKLVPYKPVENFSAEKLYEQSIKQSRSGAINPQNRSYSNDPYASQVRSSIDRLNKPPFHQLGFSRSSSKNAVNPASGIASSGRLKTPERMAHYGNMMFSRYL